MRRHRQNIGGSIGERDAAARERHQHHRAREMTSRMQQVLTMRGDPERRRVIVGAEVRPHATPACEFHQLRQFGERKRCLHHQFHADVRIRRERVHEFRDLFQRGDLRQCDHELLRQFTCGLEEPVERPQRAGLGFRCERFDAEPNERRQRAVFQSLAQAARPQHPRPRLLRHPSECQSRPRNRCDNLPPARAAVSPQRVRRWFGPDPVAYRCSRATLE